MLFSLIFGLLKIGTLASGPVNTGGEVPARRSGELKGIFLLLVGLTVHMLGGGGVSQRELEVERRLPPPGGVPITN